MAWIFTKNSILSGPDGDATQSAKKKKKKKKNKNKENEVNATNTPAKGANTPGKDSSKAPSGQEKTPGKEQPQTPKTPKRTLKGGLMVEDLKPGMIEYLHNFYRACTVWNIHFFFFLREINFGGL